MFIGRRGGGKGGGGGGGGGGVGDKGNSNYDDVMVVLHVQ